MEKSSLISLTKRFIGTFTALITLKSPGGPFRSSLKPKLEPCYSETKLVDIDFLLRALPLPFEAALLKFCGVGDLDHVAYIASDVLEPIASSPRAGAEAGDASEKDHVHSRAIISKRQHKPRDIMNGA
jgi:hypothetical protein